MKNQAKALEYIRSFEADQYLTIKDIGVDSITVEADSCTINILDCYCEAMFETSIHSSDLTNQLM